MIVVVRDLERERGLKTHHLVTLKTLEIVKEYKV